MKFRWSLMTVPAVILIGVAAWVLFPSTPQISSQELFHRALDSLNSGRSDDVEAAFERFKSDRKYRRHLALLDAVLFLRSGKPEEALRRIAPVSPTPETEELLLLYAGESLYRLNRLGQAQQVFQQLRTDYPENLDARRWLGAVFFDLGAYDAAIAELQVVTEGAPEDYRPHHLLGVMYNDFEAHEDAIRHFQHALKRNPPEATAADISMLLGSALADNRQYDESLEVIAEMPETTASLELQAQNYWYQGKATDARNALIQAEASGPLSARGLQLKAEFEEDAGNLAGSIAILEQLLKDFPDRLESRYQLAMSLQQVGREADSAEQLAIWKHRRALADQLIDLNLKAVLDPYDAQARDQLADVCRQLGRHKLADMWQRAADACRPRGILTP